MRNTDHQRTGALSRLNDTETQPSGIGSHIWMTQKDETKRAVFRICIIARVISLSCARWNLMMTNLKKIKQLKIRIKYLRQRAAEMRQKAMSLGSPALDKDIVQTSGAGDKMAEQVAAYLDLEREAEEIALKLEKRRQAIIDQILSMEDHRHAEVLYKSYVEDKRLKVIASEMGYEYGYIRNLKQKAERIFSESCDKM